MQWREDKPLFDLFEFFPSILKWKKTESWMGNNLSNIFLSEHRNDFFNNNKFNILCNKVIGERFDVKCLLFSYGIREEISWMNVSGRVLRPKEATIDWKVQKVEKYWVASDVFWRVASY